MGHAARNNYGVPVEGVASHDAGYQYSGEIKGEFGLRKRFY